MTSIPSSFMVGSTMSASSVRDVIASYRRAQYLFAGSTVPSAPAANEGVCSEEDEDEESRFRPFNEQDERYFDSNDEAENFAPHDGFVNQLEWDEDLEVSDSMAIRTDERQTSQASSSLPAMKRMAQNMSERQDAVTPLPSFPASLGVRWDTPPPRETTPLLARKVSISFDVPKQPPRRMSLSAKYGEHGHHLDANLPCSIAQRRLSNVSVARSTRSIRSIKHMGQSTFGQTLFNSIAILLGIGMLSEPLAFAYSGWFMGTVLIITYGALACYTAKILARIICSDPRLRTYSDIGRKAFGPRATAFISFMFCLELFAVSVILVTLYADSLHTIVPAYSANTYKVWGLLVLVPTVFLPLSLLSYTSILGLLSTVLLIIVVLVDGTFKKETPGSFWDPAETNLGVASMSKLGVAFGLFMAGFAGHAVIPSLARDMVDPTEFDKMINWAFVVATVIYALIGYAGYLMYGNTVSDEISMDMLNTPGFNPLLNQAALWMLVLNPLSKFALNTRPLMSTLEILLGLDPPEAAKKSCMSGVTECENRATFRKILSIIQRIVVTCASVAVSIYIPEFSVMMAFLGSFSAFCLSIVGPIAAKVKIEGRCGLLDAAIMLIGIVMAVWGTIAAFLG